MKAKWLPVVIEELCTGCGLCVEACGPRCLELENRAATLPRPEDCGSEEHCIAACPEDAIHMRWVPMNGNEQFGLWQESEDPEAPCFDEQALPRTDRPRTKMTAP